MESDIVSRLPFLCGLLYTDRYRDLLPPRARVSEDGVVEDLQKGQKRRFDEAFLDQSLFHDDSEQEEVWQDYNRPEQEEAEAEVARNASYRHLHRFLNSKWCQPFSSSKEVSLDALTKESDGDEADLIDFLFRGGTLADAIGVSSTEERLRSSSTWTALPYIERAQLAADAAEAQQTSPPVVFDGSVPLDQTEDGMPESDFLATLQAFAAFYLPDKAIFDGTCLVKAATLLEQYVEELVAEALPMEDFPTQTMLAAQSTPMPVPVFTSRPVRVPVALPDSAETGDAEALDPNPSVDFASFTVDAKTGSLLPDGALPAQKVHHAVPSWQKHLLPPSTLVEKTCLSLVTRSQQGASYTSPLFDLSLTREATPPRLNVAAEEAEEERYTSGEEEELSYGSPSEMDFADDDSLLSYFEAETKADKQFIVYDEESSSASEAEEEEDLLMSDVPIEREMLPPATEPEDLELSS